MNINFSSVANIILKLLQHCSPSGRAATNHLYKSFKISIIIIKANINVNKVMFLCLLSNIWWHICINFWTINLINCIRSDLHLNHFQRVIIFPFIPYNPIPVIFPLWVIFSIQIGIITVSVPQSSVTSNRTITITPLVVIAILRSEWSIVVIGHRIT